MRKCLLFAGLLLLMGCSEAQSMANVKKLYPDAKIYSRYDLSLLSKYVYIVSVSNRMYMVSHNGFGGHTYKANTTGWAVEEIK